MSHIILVVAVNVVVLEMAVGSAGSGNVFTFDIYVALLVTGGDGAVGDYFTRFFIGFIAFQRIILLTLHLPPI